MKANFIIGKKQIILGSLIVILSGAIYVNYLYSNTGEDYDITATLNGTDSSQTQVDASVSKVDDDNDSESSGDTVNYGDTQLVNKEMEDGTYFVEAELSKLKSRDEAVSAVNAVLDKVDISEEEKAKATAKIVEISNQIEEEGKIENLIKAKGFQECIVYVDASSASVVVKTDGLKAEQAAQIKNIVLSEKDLKPENISIVEVFD